MSELNWMIWLIPAFPLLGFLLNTFLIRNERPAGLIASGAMAFSFAATIASIVLLQSQEGEHPRVVSTLWEWMTIGAFRVPFSLLFDQLTAVMCLLVTGVGGLIHVFSIGYMHGDVRPVRYFAYLNLFIVAMLMLVMGDNLLLLFLGWEGVGLCSYLLIGHWFDRRTVPPGIVPAEASVKAFVVNRIGDVGLLIGMFLIFSRFGTLSFFPNEQLGIAGFLDRAREVAFVQLDLGIFGSIGLIDAIGLLLLIGVTGKSAQTPLFVWLVDAMAGPTPVSALIHAATMVTSGVYLIARNHTIYTAGSAAAGLVVTIGVLTALIAASAAVAQWDIKRVLAYSTISQLGYMVAAVGMGAYVAGMFHLLTHGLFKALLFLGSGSVIHGAHETQDMRKMGGLRQHMPTTFWTYLIGAFALSGIVPFAGFWSKDEIIGHAWEIESYGAFLFLTITSLLTAFYMGRQVALVFYGRQRDTSYHAHESGPTMRWPLIILAAGSLIGGAMNLPGLLWLEQFLHPVFGGEPTAFTLGKGILAAITTLLALGAGLLGWYLYAHVVESRIKVDKEDPAHYYLGFIWEALRESWGFDWFYRSVIVRGYRVTARFLSNVFDAQGIDGILVDGSARAIGRFAQAFRATQSGYVRNYALVFLVGVIVMVAYFALAR